MTSTAIQHVYRHGGDYRTAAQPIDADPQALPRVPTVADCVPARQIMTRRLVCAREDLDVDTAATLMTRERIGCLPIIDADGFPIGMVTKQDLIEELAARCDDAPPTLAVGRLMMPMAFTLGEQASVAHAAALMSIEHVHHVPIVARDGRLIGLVSSHDIVRWLVANDGVLGG